MRARILVGLLLFVLVPVVVLAQATRGFAVEAKTQDVLEKAAGVRERYALLIGISKYANPAINLNFAAAAAQSLAKLLLDPDVGGYKTENVKLLLDSEATRKNVMSALKSWLGNRVKEEDSVVVFYSGHGALGNGSEAYWVTYDADVEDLSSSALSNKEISSLLAALPARRKLTLIDSCFSEATAKKYRALVPANVFEEFKGEGVVTIAASTGQQKSVETGGHGAFTYHLLDGFSGKADANGNGVVEIDELWTYLNEKVQKTAADAGNKQTPVLMADRLEHGFPLSINPSKAAGTVLAGLKQMYSEGTINADEMREADRIFNERAGNPELRKLYRDLAAKALPITYFRQLRQVAAAAPPPAMVGRPAATQASPGALRTQAAAPAAGAAAAGGTELEAFNVAQAMNSIEAWAGFMQRFPDGQLAAAAKIKISELEQKNAEQAAYNIAKQSDTERGWEQYLSQFPAGSFTGEAQRRMSELKQQREAELAAYRLAESKSTEAGWEKFLKEYPKGQLAVIAEDRLETVRRIAREKENALYAQSLKNSTLDDWDKYITAYPDGRFIAEATSKRAELAKRLEEERQRKIENDTYAAARAGDTTQSWSEYVARYAAGPHTAEAKARLEQLKWLAFADPVPLPAGAFMMGANDHGDAKPPHRVELDAFRIGRGEVTNEQYQRFLDETKHRRPADPHFAKNYLLAYPDLPAVMVSYDDAAEFCKWLSRKMGASVRLPTEAEWEYAARGGKEGVRFPWGNEKSRTAARSKDNDPSGVKTSPRDAFPANGYGLRNMAGNVAEWVSDYYSENYYKTSARRNPTGPPAGKERVYRGGSWNSGEDELECARREKHNPLEPSDHIGFRIVVVWPVYEPPAAFGVATAAAPQK